jgi:hypothetical protein
MAKRKRDAAGEGILDDQDAVVGHSGGSVASAAPAREGPSPVISRTPTSKVKYDQTHPRMTEN